MNSAKVDLTLQDAHRNTALHLACSKGTTPPPPEPLIYMSIIHRLSYDGVHVFICPIAVFQGHETCALLILEKISDRNLINCTNATLQT